MKQQDAVALLKADHKTVKELFAQVEETSERAKATLQRLGDEICSELTIHTEIEEQIFYPAVKERAQRKRDDEEKDLVLESIEEHAAAKKVIEDIRATDSGDESYKPKITTLSELIDHHVKEEEREMFPKAKKLMSEDELVDLGQQMAQLKAQLQQRQTAKT
ncbi:MAG TPA: hemerythrin domain-containing protein [Candidatus Elarobacter sp.]|jgi:hemerythrin superfamily protein|nr:hemerythrin domain-containing protein [Candidatus Elarobacter sp.]